MIGILRIINIIIISNPLLKRDSITILTLTKILIIMVITTVTIITIKDLLQIIILLITITLILVSNSMIIRAILTMEAIKAIKAITQVIKDIIKTDITFISRKNLQATFKLTIKIKFSKVQAIIMIIKINHNININNKILKI